MTTVTVTKDNQSRQFPFASLAAICLQICGGGYTVSQTAQAMELQTKIVANGKATKNKITVVVA